MLSRPLDGIARDHVDRDRLPCFQRLDTSGTYRRRGVAVPRPRAVGVVAGGIPGPDRVHPALDLDVIGLAEPLLERGRDLSAPVARCALAQQPDVQADHRTTLFA